jgi:iron complex outermembrane receptor protein
MKGIGFDARLRLLASAAFATGLAGLPTTVLAQAGQAASSTGSGTPVQGSAASLDQSRVDATPEQAGAPDVDNSGINDIVVTAQKRSERLVQVPVAVTAVSGATLSNQQINDSQSLSRIVPSLTFQQGANPTNSSFRIRGVGTALFSQGTESAVSVVVDGVVTARAGQGFSDLVDIERVEVLRGPQGTLFGKNATAGVVNVVTARPGKEFGGRIDGTIAEYGEYRLKGTVTGPISDTLRARLTGFYNDVRGTLYNVSTQRFDNSSKSWGARGKLEWDATPNLNLLLTGEYRKTTSNCCQRVYVRIDNPIVQQFFAPAVASISNRQSNNDGASFANPVQINASLEANWDLGFATVTSISAFQRFVQTDQYEPDQVESDPVRYSGAGAYSQWNNNLVHNAFNNFSEELRIGSNGNSDLTYVLGGYYAHFDLDRSGSRRRFKCPSGVINQVCTVPTTSDSAAFVGTYKSDNVAGFGQIDWRAFGGLHLIGGLRVTYETQTASGRSQTALFAGDASFPGVTPNSGTRTRDGTAVTGRAGARYEFTRNLQAYATYTRGYKAFAMDLDFPTNYVTNPGVNPEHVNAYEAGLKWSAPGGVFSINAAVFRSDYTDLQVQAIQSDATTGVFNAIQVNAGKSRSQGVELEATVRPSSNFSVAMNFNYLDATIDVDGQTCALQQQAAAQVFTANFPVNTCYLRRTTTNGVTTTSSAIIDVRNGSLPLAPKIRFGITPRYEQDFDSIGLAGFIQASLNYQSAVQFQLSQDPLTTQPGYALVDLTVGVSDIDKKYQLSLFVRNLFNEKYLTNLQHATFLATAANPFDLNGYYAKDADRYFGASMSVRF